MSWSLIVEKKQARSFMAGILVMLCCYFIFIHNNTVQTSSLSLAIACLQSPEPVISFTEDILKSKPVVPKVNEPNPAPEDADSSKEGKEKGTITYEPIDTSEPGVEIDDYVEPDLPGPGETDAEEEGIGPGGSTTSTPPSTIVDPEIPDTIIPPGEGFDTFNGQLRIAIKRY